MKAEISLLDNGCHNVEETGTFTLMLQSKEYSSNQQCERKIFMLEKGCHNVEETVTFTLMLMLMLM